METKIKDANLFLRKFIGLEINDFSITGTDLKLGGGRKKIIKAPIKDNKKLLVLPEYGIFIPTNWRLLKNNIILATSNIKNDDEYYLTLEIFEKLKLKKIIDIKIIPKTFDLKIFFEEGYLMQSFFYPSLILSKINDDSFSPYFFSVFNDYCNIGIDKKIRIKSINNYKIVDDCHFN